MPALQIRGSSKLVSPNLTHPEDDESLAVALKEENPDFTYHVTDQGIFIHGEDLDTFDVMALRAFCRGYRTRAREL